MEPANTIIKMCGGFSAVAQMVGRSEIRIRRWTYEKERGGTGGLVPSDLQQPLLRLARDRGIDLRPEHFFPDAQPAGSSSPGIV